MLKIVKNIKKFECLTKKFLFRIVIMMKLCINFKIIKIAFKSAETISQIGISGWIGQLFILVTPIKSSARVIGKIDARSRNEIKNELQDISQKFTARSSVFKDVVFARFICWNKFELLLSVWTSWS